MEKMNAATVLSQRKIAEKQQKLGPITDTGYDHFYDHP